MDASHVSSFSGFTWQQQPPRSAADYFYQNSLENDEKVDWQAVCNYASRLNSDTSCEVLCGLGMGGRHIIRIIQFSTGQQWVVRIRQASLYTLKEGDDQEAYRKWREDNAAIARREVSCLHLVRERSTIPVPLLYGFRINTTDMSGIDIMFMECLRGNMVYDLGRGTPPDDRKELLYHQLAKFHVEMSAITFPKIGSITRLPDGTYEVGPLPNIGGPFDTAADYLRAWATNVAFTASTEEHFKAYCGENWKGIQNEVEAFPTRVAEFADVLALNNEGPFPLIHGDFGLNNLLVDDDYQSVGVIDWEDSRIVPWEVIDFPLDVPHTTGNMIQGSFDDNGNPLTTEVRESLVKEEQYIMSVQYWEQMLNLPPNLSRRLSNRPANGFATALSEYDRSGMGYYCKTLDDYLASLPSKTESSKRPSLMSISSSVVTWISTSIAQGIAHAPRFFRASLVFLLEPFASAYRRLRAIFQPRRG